MIPWPSTSPTHSRTSPSRFLALYLFSTFFPSSLSDYPTCIFLARLSCRAYPSLGAERFKVSAVEESTEMACAAGSESRAAASVLSHLSQSCTSWPKSIDFGIADMLR